MKQITQILHIGQAYLPLITTYCYQLMMRDSDKEM